MDRKEFKEALGCVCGTVAFIPGPIRVERVIYALAEEFGLDEAVRLFIFSVDFVVMGNRIWKSEEFLREFRIVERVSGMLEREKEVEIL